MLLLGLGATEDASFRREEVPADTTRRTQTPVTLRPAVIRRHATASDESGMHGKEKVYGSIP